MNTTDILKYGHLTVLRAIENLPEAAWEMPGVCGVWSVREILAHLASYEHLLVDVFGSLLDGGPTPYLDRYTREFTYFNDSEVAQRQEKSRAETLAEYNETQAKTMELVTQISAATLRQNGTLPWYGLEYSLDDFIVYTYYGHKREHCAQINTFRDRLGVNS